MGADYLSKYIGHFDGHILRHPLIYDQNNKDWRISEIELWENLWLIHAYSHVVKSKQTIRKIAKFLINCGKKDKIKHKTHVLLLPFIYKIRRI